MELIAFGVAILIAVSGWVIALHEKRKRRLDRKEDREERALLLEGQHVLKKAVATQGAALEKLLPAPTVSPEIRAEAEAAIKMGAYAIATVIPAETSD